MNRRHARGLLGALVVGLLVSLLPAGSPAGAAEVLVDEIDIYSNALGSVQSVPLDPAKLYRIDVSGAYSYGQGVADASCHNVASGPMLPAIWDAAVGMNALDLLVNGAAVAWAPAQRSPVGCDDPLLGGSNSYSVAFTPPVSGPASFSLNDQNPFDNAGAIHIKIFEVDAVQTILALVPFTAVRVNANDASGETSAVSLPGGQTYVLELSGSFSYAPFGDIADAECSVTSVDATWQPARFPDIGGMDALDVLVNGTDVDWTAVGTGDPGCSAGNTYRLVYAPDVAGPVTFAINDLNYFDNSGAVTVVVYLAV